MEIVSKNPFRDKEIRGYLQNLYTKTQRSFLFFHIDEVTGNINRKSFKDEYVSVDEISEKS